MMMMMMMMITEDRQPFYLTVVYSPGNFVLLVSRSWLVVSHRCCRPTSCIHFASVRQVAPAAFVVRCVLPTLPTSTR